MNTNTRDRRRVSYLFLAIMLILTIGVVTSPHIFWPHFLWQYEPLHSTIESIGAAVAILTGITLLQRTSDDKSAWLFWIAVGLLGGGILDLFHAVTQPGYGFVILHTAATIIGGIGFALVWLPDSNAFRQMRRPVLLAFVTGSMLFGIWTLLLPETLPVMLQDGEFTRTALWMRNLASSLFAFAAVRLLIDYHRFSRTEHLMFGWMALLSGMASLTFRDSRLWDDAWWFWHAVRLSAYLLAAVFVIKSYKEATSHLEQEVAQRRQAEADLRQSEEKYHNLFEHAEVGMYRSKLDGSAMMEVNSKLCEIFGYSRDELLSNPANIRWANQKGREEMVRRLKEQGTLTDYEVEVITKNDKIKTLLASMKLYPSEGYLEGSVIDISDRRTTELALQDSLRFNSTVLDNSPHPIMVRDKDASITYVNPALEKLTGLAKADLTGKKDIYTFWTEEEIENHGGSLEEVIHAGVRARERQFLKKSGEPFWVEITATIVENRGQTRYFISNWTDISDRKQAEASLKKTLAELERSNDELQRFAYVASHDLQEPLRMISSYVQLLERRYKDKLDPDANDFINFTVDGVSRMKNLINDLLAYSRVGSQARPPVPTNMETVFGTAIKNLQVAINESGAEISHDELPTVLSDQGQMVQVLQNLLSNAIKFRGTRPPRIHVSAETIRKDWVFSVKDNGIGIEPQYFERIFFIFQRLNGQQYPGTGAGLAIVKRIVERHRGRIWVESEPGKGSTFRFSIPQE